ncbi:hypothetical protein [Tabrizicola sp. YIM 78059]|uniref:hypothetical protein n=1 Tax=Tabrizicola sp. YIM 78059 TaxID=2529861 RepID=UPI0010A9E83B|nr:hypothetical protein [Tabrizicola sp. YIM 78059]
MRLLSLAVLGASLAVPALAETNAECIFQMDRHDVLVGPCLGSEREPSKAFAISSPDGSIAARVASTGGGAGHSLLERRHSGPTGRYPDRPRCAGGRLLGQRQDQALHDAIAGGTRFD